ncbi:MAG: alkaline phosphatase family protein [Actinomycetota bacterium]|nr:alkaline phosphatase family protein [Actinomycetota bacterium]
MQFVVALIVAVSMVAISFDVYDHYHLDPVPSFQAQACSLPRAWLERIQRGYYAPRSGQISFLPRTPAYMATGAGGWSHSGPWEYLQHIPIVFYGPGIIPSTGNVSRPVTMADIAPTLAALLHGQLQTDDGHVMPEAAKVTGKSLRAKTPRLILTVVWDGGGWDVLNHWGRSAWPNLANVMKKGVTFTSATDGSSPSVTPAIHTTLGTGVFPWKHGITDVPVLDENGDTADSFENGGSSRFIQVETLAERWDESNGNRAKIGMIGYEPWHLGMIGQGSERQGGDKDDAAWLDRITNDWITNPDHYTLPPALPSTPGLEKDLRATDAADGKIDGAWRDNAILNDRDRIEEVPGFVDYQTRGIERVIKAEHYAQDDITDMMFTNYKQIDRNAHYYNMAAPEVRDSMVEVDRQLPKLVSFLNHDVGKGKWVMVITADHGTQPDASDINAYGIAPKVIAADIDAHFGPITQAVWPTQIFMDADAMRAAHVTDAEVARWLYNYRLRDNAQSPSVALAGAGRYGPNDRILQMAIPSHLLPEITCGSSPSK